MKNNLDCNIIREKLGSLDPLSVGVVFGKEQAWDKLQARLDKKPSLTPHGHRWAAVAAMLLLTVSVVGYFDCSNHSNHLAKANPRFDKPNVSINAARLLYRSAVPSPVTPQIRPKCTSADRSGRRGTSKSKISKKEQTFFASDIIPGRGVGARLPDSQVTVVVRLNSPAPATFPMQVIHVNELGNRPENNFVRAIASVADQSIDTRNLKVLHNNELNQQQFDIKELLRFNNRTLVHTLFSRPAAHDLNYYSDDDIQPGRILKSFFKNQ